MGQKTHPYVIRIGISNTWRSSWFAKKKDYSKYIKQDFMLRDYLKEKLQDAGITDIKILRPQGKLSAVLFSAKPGVIIGRNGENIELLRSEINKKFKINCDISVKEVKAPMLSASFVAKEIATSIERRIPYRRAVKSIMEKIMQSGAKGVKVNVAGRLNGVEIARSEFFKDGTIPLQTFRSGISYDHVDSHTMYGIIGVNVWIYTGEVFDMDVSLNA